MVGASDDRADCMPTNTIRLHWSVLHAPQNKLAGSLREHISIFGLVIDKDAPACISTGPMECNNARLKCSAFVIEWLILFCNISKGAKFCPSNNMKYYKYIGHAPCRQSLTCVPGQQPR